MVLSPLLPLFLASRLSKRGITGRFIRKTRALSASKVKLTERLLLLGVFNGHQLATISGVLQSDGLTIRLALAHAFGELSLDGGNGLTLKVVAVSLKRLNLLLEAINGILNCLELGNVSFTHGGQMASATVTVGQGLHRGSAEQKSLNEFHI